MHYLSYVYSFYSSHPYSCITFFKLIKYYTNTTTIIRYRKTSIYRLQNDNTNNGNSNSNSNSNGNGNDNKSYCMNLLRYLDSLNMKMKELIVIDEYNIISNRIIMSSRKWISQHVLAYMPNE